MYGKYEPGYFTQFNQLLFVTAALCIVNSLRPSDAYMRQ